MFAVPMDEGAGGCRFVLIVLWRRSFFYRLEELLTTRYSLFMIFSFLDGCAQASFVGWLGSWWNVRRRLIWFVSPRCLMLVLPRVAATAVSMASPSPHAFSCGSAGFYRYVKLASVLLILFSSLGSPFFACSGENATQTHANEELAGNEELAATGKRCCGLTGRVAQINRARLAFCSVHGRVVRV